MLWCITDPPTCTSHASSSGGLVSFDVDCSSDSQPLSFNFSTAAIVGGAFFLQHQEKLNHLVIAEVFVIVEPRRKYLGFM
jgi:hypothetical protein